MDEKAKRIERIQGGALLATIAVGSAIAGFARTISLAKRADPKYFDKGLSHADLADAGALLALRALGWGTLYAVTGTSLLCFGIWKLSGAQDLQDFRVRMGNILPKIPKNNPPRSRTEFSGLNDLMTYVSTEKFGDKPIPNDVKTDPKT